jgi:hypothetical protein
MWARKNVQEVKDNEIIMIQELSLKERESLGMAYG